MAARKHWVTLKGGPCHGLRREMVGTALVLLTWDGYAYYQHEPKSGFEHESIFLGYSKTGGKPRKRSKR